ncbi:SAM-dependent methyltransferase [Catellatospora chokoriensis]|uniref:SAM-dependent methyltransferase n=1 Tax=Catellatospora chokoriensis TaxID=310353 RepID=UPI00177A911B|nr:SAM-dependent methyltransferase [Catellatospora chokoriensis]
MEASVSQGGGPGAGGEEVAPPGVDTSTPHSARMYDWWLGGKDNFAADRAMGDAFIQAIPTIKTMAKENRKFLGRAVNYLVADAGVRQFLDIGTGIPTRPNLHEDAQAVAPETRVVYVDNDPIVLAHARALLVSSEQGRSEYIHADLRKPQEILSDPALLQTLDLSKPVALMMVAVLMLLKDAEDPWGHTRELMDALPSGSYLTITHPGREFDEEAMEVIRSSAERGGMTVIPRTKADVARFFEGWDLVEPGVVPVMAWHPDGELADPNGAFYWAGMARKR